MIQNFATSIIKLACNNLGCDACVEALAPSSLVKLASLASVQGSEAASKHVAWAIWIIAFNEKGRAALISAGAQSALAMLAELPVVKGSADAAEKVASALKQLAA